jgi:hypothetical protein
VTGRVLVAAAQALGAIPGTATAAVDSGPISHKGLRSAGVASGSLKLGVRVGLEMYQSNIAAAVNAASKPASSSFGQYPSLSMFPEQVRRPEEQSQGGQERVREAERQPAACADTRSATKEER